MFEKIAYASGFIIIEWAGTIFTAGQCFRALFPDGWHDITLEVRWDPTGLGYWYISTPGFKDVCPVGLFVKCK